MSDRFPKFIAGIEEWVRDSWKIVLQFYENWKGTTLIGAAICLVFAATIALGTFANSLSAIGEWFASDDADSGSATVQFHQEGNVVGLQVIGNDNAVHANYGVPPELLGRMEENGHLERMELHARATRIEDENKRLREDAKKHVQTRAAAGSKAAAAALQALRDHGDEKALMNVLIAEADELDEQIETDQTQLIARCREIAALAKASGDHTEAEQRLTKILSLRPNDVQALWQLGELYRNQKKVGLAEQQYLHVASLCPDTNPWGKSGALYELGTFYEITGQYDKAEATYLALMKFFDSIYGVVTMNVGDEQITFDPQRQKDKCYENLSTVYLSVVVHGFSSCHRWILASWFMLSRHGDAMEDLPELRTSGSPSG